MSELWINDKGICFRCGIIVAITDKYCGEYCEKQHEVECLTASSLKEEG